jgi:fatty acid desaturase
MLKEYPSISEIRKKIPPHCFERDEKRFLLSLGINVVVILGWLCIFYTCLFNRFENVYINNIIWIMYSLITGTLSIGFWVLGHECGHETFSNQKWKNNLLGFILHTPLLVPFLSWKHSHAVHHSKTGHIYRDETHVPKIIKNSFVHTIIESDVFSILQVISSIISIIIGWYLYLIFGTTGGPARGWTSHLIVPNNLFTKRHLPGVLLSDLAVLLMLYVIYQFPFESSFRWYWGPYIINNCWLVFYTFMQHHGNTIRWYNDESWSFERGAFQTVDRPSYGWIGRVIHHRIGTNHVIHHLFSKMPHYHCEEATIPLREYYCEFYNCDTTPLWKAFLKNSKYYVIETTKNVYQYV